MYPFPIGARVDSFRQETREAIKTAASIGVQGLQMYATTGENAPEEVDGIAGWQIGMSGATAKKGYKDIDNVEKEDDFCGLYLGSSGHYVVAVKNPTRKRARQYAKIAGGDIWVVQGEYTWKEMTKAQHNQ